MADGQAIAATGSRLGHIGDIPQTEAKAAGGRFEVLDSLRGVCAVLVVLYHVVLNNHLAPLSFIRGGYMFVDFFFVLSGFVIAYNYAGRIRDKSSFGDFLIKRFFRLWPLHLFLLMLYFVVEIGGLAGTEMGSRTGRTVPDLIRTGTLTNAIGMDHQSNWNMPSWSISGEWWTYIVFGLIVLVLPRLFRPALLGLVAVGLAVIVTNHDSIHIMADHGIFRCFVGFGLGAFLATIWPAVAPRLEALGNRWLGTAEIALVIGIPLFVAASRLTAWSFLAPFVFVIAVAVFALERGPVSRLLHHRLFLRAGLLSFSIYMVHNFVMGRVANAAGFVQRHTGLQLDYSNAVQMDVLTLVTIVAVWFAAEATYRLVEKPGQALGGRVSARWKRRARAA